MTDKQKKDAAAKQDTPPQPNPMVQTRDQMESRVSRAFFTFGFNDYVKAAMTKEDRAEFDASTRIGSRVVKYSILGGILLAASPSLLRSKRFHFSLLKFYFRWPIRLSLFVLPFTICWFKHEPFQKSIKVQEKLFDKYTKMDPNEIQKKLPPMGMSFLPGMNKTIEANLRKK